MRHNTFTRTTLNHTNVRHSQTRSTSFPKLMNITSIQLSINMPTNVLLLAQVHEKLVVRHLAVGAQCRREVHAAELCAAALDQPVHGRRRRCERLPRLRVTRLVLGRIGAQLPQNLG